MKYRALKQGLALLGCAAFGGLVCGQTSQLNLGSGHTVMNLADGPVNINSPVTTVLPSPDTKDIAVSLNRIVRYLEASNPTRIQLKGARMRNWLGETEPMLTLELANDSKLGGYKVKAVLLGRADAKGKTRTQSMKTVRGLSQQTLDALHIQAGDSIGVPIANMAELRQLVDFPAGYELIGAGVTPELPEALQSDYLNQLPRVNGGAGIATLGVPIGVKLTYRTAFDATTTTLTSVFLYFAKPVAPLPMIILGKGIR